MQPFGRHRGIAAPLDRANVDTDMIIRIERFMTHPRKALGPFAFEMLRRLPDGSEDLDCILNREPFRRASILVAGRNFGCGSSREAAVWAIAAMGVCCLMAPSFGDIFRENCIKNGLLPIVLDEAVCAALRGALASSPNPEIEVDLEAETLTFGTDAISFAIGRFEREQLLTGEDEVASTLKRGAEIDVHFARWEAANPWAALRSPPHFDLP